MKKKKSPAKSVRKTAAARQPAKVTRPPTARAKPKPKRKQTKRKTDAGEDSTARSSASKRITGRKAAVTTVTKPGRKPKASAKPAPKATKKPVKLDTKAAVRRVKPKQAAEKTGKPKAALTVLPQKGKTKGSKGIALAKKRALPKASEAKPKAGGAAKNRPRKAPGKKSSKASADKLPKPSGIKPEPHKSTPDVVARATPASQDERQGTNTPVSKAVKVPVSAAGSRSHPCTPTAALPSPAPAAVLSSKVVAPIARTETVPRTQASFHIPAILLQGDEPYVPPPSKIPRLRERRGERPGEGPASLRPRDEIVLIPRDPHCVYVAWDMAPDRQQRFNALSSEGHLVLRLNMVSHPSTPQPDIALHPISNHWFAPVTHAGAAYTAHLGYFDETGGWHEVARSRQTTTPPDAPVERHAKQEIEPPLPLPLFPADAPLVMSKPDVAQNTQPMAESAAVEARLPTTPEALAKPTALAPISDQSFTAAIVPSSAPHTPPVSAQTSATPTFDQAQAGADIQPSPVVVPSSFGAHSFPSRTPGSVPRAQREYRAQSETRRKLYSLAIGQFSKPANSGPSSAELAGRDQFKRIEELPGSATASDAPPGIQHAGSSEQSLAGPVDSVSSAEAPVPQAASEQPFWLRVNAELVIYGATIPDAQVAISGRPIKLRPDGSFSYRFALPDGNYDLRIVAVSSDGEHERAADLKFSRASAYRGEVAGAAADPSLRPPRPEHL